MARRIPALFLKCAMVIGLLSLAACGRSDDGPLEVAFIDDPEALFADGVRLSSGAQHVRGATGAGLVSLDERGEVIPALADRWIVTEDGLSFIFRLRDGEWGNGQALTSESVRAELRRVIASLRGTSLGLDLAAIAEVRAMAGRVVEIRLSTPVPMLMQLLAQPELALQRGPVGMGPMQLDRAGEVAVLSMKPPQDRGAPEMPDWQDHVRTVRLAALSARDAANAFYDGDVDMVLGGRLGALPMVETGPLSRGTVRLDPMQGLFGLRVNRAAGFLATRENREVLALALDRQQLMAPFGVGGWTATTRIVPPGLADDTGLIAERWVDTSFDDLTAIAVRRVAAWRQESGTPPRLTLAIGRSPGEDQLLDELARQYAEVGIRLERAGPDQAADLAMVDQSARYAGMQWFLNQFHCSLRRGMCDSAADALVAEVRQTADPEERSRLLASAEAELTRANIYIPLGTPIRFSLVRGSVAGFAPNSWGYHPLPALAVIPR